MALPPLRKPKFLQALTENIKTEKHLILTLRSGTKLVLSSDAYNGILRIEDKIKCVFCDLITEYKEVNKELHVSSDKHVQCMNSYRYIEHFGDHLMKQINREEIYCVICNTLVSVPKVNRHIASEVHHSELQKAKRKIGAYEAI